MWLCLSCLAGSVLAQDAPFHVTVTAHVEASTYVADRALFFRHVARLRWCMDLFEEYGATLTLESERAFARANIRWKVSLLAEAVRRGHGVGTHANFGAEDPPLTVSQLQRRFAENKAAVDRLVGADENRGVSGGLADARDFVPDAEPVLTVTSGALGELASLAEGRVNCAPACVLDAADVAAFEAAFLAAEAVRDPARPAKVNVHLNVRYMDRSNAAALRRLLGLVETWVGEGRVTWATERDAWEAYAGR